MIYPYPDTLTWPEHSGLYDDRLDYPASGLLLYCLTRLDPETRVTIRQLSQSTGFNYKRVRRDLHTLQRYEYAIKRVTRLARGRVGAPYYDLYAVPESIYRKAVLPTSGTETAISGKSVDTAHMSPRIIGHRNGQYGQIGEGDLTNQESILYTESDHRNGHIGQISSLSSSLSIKEREEERHRNGQYGQIGDAPSCMPGSRCSHYTDAMRRILAVIHARYPHYQLPSTHVHDQVWETVHLPEFGPESIEMIYRYLVSELSEAQTKGKKPDFNWLGPNKTLSRKTRDNHLAAARQWAAEPGSAAVCPHPPSKIGYNPMLAQYHCFGCFQDVPVEVAAALGLDEHLELEPKGS